MLPEDKERTGSNDDGGDNLPPGEEAMEVTSGGGGGSSMQVPDAADLEECERLMQEEESKLRLLVYFSE